MIYRHWTAAVRVESILAEGIRPTDSMLTSAGDGGVRVVWLLPTDVDPGNGNEHGLIPVKRTGWVDVEVGALRWLDWLPAQSMSRPWREAVIRSGGGPEAAALWYVWPGPIPPTRIVGHGYA